jgi:hypothetical protein
VGCTAHLGQKEQSPEGAADDYEEDGFHLKLTFLAAWTPWSVRTLI